MILMTTSKLNLDHSYFSILSYKLPIQNKMSQKIESGRRDGKSNRGDFAVCTVVTRV